MSWTNLPTDYTDATFEGLRKYQQITNSDNTVSFKDVTTYTQRENSFFGADDANQMNAAMNELATNIESVAENAQKAEEAATTATTQAYIASASAITASDKASSASASATNAANSASSASVSATKSETAQGKAEAAKSDAETSATSAATSAQTATEKATSAATSAQTASNSASDVETAKTDIQDSIDGVAQEDTAQEALTQIDRIAELLEEISSSSKGFSMKLGENSTVILSYTDPDNELITDAITFPTYDTLNQIVAKMGDIVTALIEIASKGDNTGDTSTLTTTNKVLVDAVNEVNAKTDWKIVRKSLTAIVTDGYSYITADMSETGFTPVGVVGYYVESSLVCTVPRVEIVDSKVHLVLQLTTSTVATLPVYINVLYVPS